VRRLTRTGRRDDGGLVAVIVCLVVVLVLVPVAALALDLGSTYAVEAAAQRAVDAAATAGAQELARRQRQDGVSAGQAMDAARQVAVDVLCHDATLNPGPPDADGVPQGPWYGVCARPARAWATDLDGGPAAHPNGEVQFYTGPAPPATHLFAATALVTATSSLYGGVVSGIRVVTPPVILHYGLASIFGRSTGTVQASATAELRTVLPARDRGQDAGGTTGGANLPLYLTESDLASTGGGWCARSAPRQAWIVSGTTESNHPVGLACDPTRQPSVPRGYLRVPDATQAVLVPGTTGLALQPQLWTQVARLRDLRASLLDAGGRLVQSGCPGGNGANTGGYGGVEAAHLGDFADGVSASDLKALVLSGARPTPAQEGRLSTRVLRCGRLAVLPVLRGIAAPPPLGLTGSTYLVEGLRLVWLDSEFTGGDAAPIATAPNGCLLRGLYWENVTTRGYCPPRDETWAPLRAITGYVVDPRLLPAVVTGSDASRTTGYVGSGLPATARLVRDWSDQLPT